ncbi:glycoside hydrolase 5 family protein [Deinococcus marmoris]|uniref:glycoside hydrolase 5 family protein n=1 Tax=Deinococcus marmoris TaxID=249408 RepID=UPI000497FBFC|nr:cellulase family glycosylhydrolase [Deinococcus marmoris]
MTTHPSSPSATLPATLLGVNYWPVYAGPRMWRDFRPHEITCDLAALKDVGVDYLRAFLFWPDFMPTPSRVEPQMLDRLEEFLDLCQTADLKVHLSFLVGHMSGENWSPAWLDDPTRLYSDPVLLDIQARYLREVTARVGQHPALAAYVLSNEMPIYAGVGTTATVGQWAERLCGVLAGVQPRLPVSLGDGAWYCLGDETGFSPDHAQDILAPHLYIAETDAGRQIAAYGLAVGTATALAHGREVWLEEFGASQNTFGEAQIAEFAGRVATEARLQGASHICWWCGFDFELEGDLPYFHHGFELRFGLLNSDRTPKLAAAALREAVRAPLPELPEVGLLVTSYLPEHYPFSWDDRDFVKRALRNSYAALRNLGYRPRIVPEREFLAGTAIVPDILLVPSTQKLLAPTWGALARHAGRVIYSYFHGALDIHTGAWVHDAGAFFGALPHNRYGLSETAPTQLLAAGESWPLPAHANALATTPLLLDAEQLGEAELIGTDELGRPLWVRTGNRDLLLYPLEALAQSPEAVEPIYRALLASVGADARQTGSQQTEPQRTEIRETVAGDD